VLIDNRTGAQVAIATKGPNTFTFANVAIETGSSWRIDKMRVVQASVGPIIAQVSVTAPPITFTVIPPVFVATGV
jgi:hypothetical protein